MIAPTMNDHQSLLALQECGRVDGKRLPNLRDKKYLGRLVGKGLNILDAGCGDGRYILSFARVGATAIGVDDSPTLPGRVKTSAKKLKLKNAFGLTGDLKNLPLQSELFDLYTSFNVYDKFRHGQQRRMLAEAYRVLKPGGLIYLEVPQFWSAWTFRREFRYWFRRLFPPGMDWQGNLSRFRLVRDGERLGFKTLETHVFDAWSGFEKGLSLDCGKLLGVPNIFRSLRPTLRKLSDFCDEREWAGHTLVFIGRKPGGARDSVYQPISEIA